ncbi:MAG TPA: LamG domain-containing protein [Hanamia sp.]|nr:LamG domain-containing protein [Hanamia sp.]
MKSFQILLLGVPFYILLCFCGSGLSSCTKDNTVHDTTTLIIKDTVTIKDTVVISDTVMGKLTKGLIAYYNFNGGNTNDSSGNSNNIVFNSATPTTDRFGNPNNAFLFDGSSSYMQVKNSPSLNPDNITMYAIVKPLGFYQGPCHGNQILSKGYPYNINGFYQLNFFPIGNDAGGGACALTIDSTKEFFVGGFGDNNPQGSSAGAPGNSSIDSVYIQKNQWYTLVYTYDGSTSKFYVNGALASSIPNAKPITFTPNSYDLLIGKHENPLYPYYFKGVIDEIRIYNRAITDQEVGYLNIFRSKYLRTSKKTIY